MKRKNMYAYRSGHIRAGFTIIEVMIVLVIIGIIGAIVTMNLVGQTDRARVSATKTTMGTLQNALTQLRAERGSYPPSPNGSFPHEILTIVNDTKDAWGNEIMYFAPDPYPDYYGGPFVLISAGPDGEFDTPDDIIVRPKPQQP
ncbi:MAG: prepilin-type N-terminal cleavage/methylation domain-containing protein [Phycisphaeraceae bacterium]|nr:MAG: prepilin-type N-terminal cleavage/methylation domain-containing protein [Phycisphaeraceae bacterium]